KPVALARRMDLGRAVANLRFFAGAARHLEQPAYPTEGVLHWTVRQPVGVAGLITPWNLPLYLLTWKLAPALVMGNTVVAKPSELTPLTADALARLAVGVGIPAGVFNVVHGLGAEVGHALVAHPEVPLISFTGGTATGRAVAATAAPMFKKLSLELGGKNATIVFADADVGAALEGALRAAFTNQGEICLCGSRVFVQRPLYDRFVAALVERVHKLKVADPGAPDTDLGALISAAHRDKVEGYVRLGREEGGRTLVGGNRPTLPAPLDGGFFLNATVIAGLAPTCRTATEEIFGPVITVHPFDAEEEAIAAHDAVRYGLSASLWTTDLARAHRVALALRTGMVWVNGWLLRDLRSPFGGVKDSGVGREGGRWSLDLYSETKSISFAWD
ncbi:MAG TPA: aldehyde dehydrogenase, partial [Myxococcota bacterium]|nr:aldehyde dehydrogenase [Myxococcota bacterium]